MVVQVQLTLEAPSHMQLPWCTARRCWRCSRPRKSRKPLQRASRRQLQRGSACWRTGRSTTGRSGRACGVARLQRALGRKSCEPSVTLQLQQHRFPSVLDLQRAAPAPVVQRGKVRCSNSKPQRPPHPAPPTTTCSGGRRWRRSRRRCALPATLRLLWLGESIASRLRLPSSPRSKLEAAALPQAQAPAPLQVPLVLPQALALALRRPRRATRCWSRRLQTQLAAPVLAQPLLALQ